MSDCSCSSEIGGYVVIITLILQMRIRVGGHEILQRERVFKLSDGEDPAVGQLARELQEHSRVELEGGVWSEKRGNKERRVQIGKSRGGGRRMGEGRTDVQKWRQSLLEQIAQ